MVLVHILSLLKEKWEENMQKCLSYNNGGESKVGNDKNVNKEEEREKACKNAKNKDTDKSSQKARNVCDR